MGIAITRIGRHQVVKGTEIVSSHSDLKEADERASQLPDGVYDIVTANERIAVTGNAAPPPPPPPTPVDCAGTWGPWERVAGSESECAGGTRTYQERRVFTVTQAPANGGAACPLSPETRTATEACADPPPPPPPSSGLLGRLLDFAQTWKRNWNHGGHAIDARFTEAYGRWDYTETTSEPWLFDRATVGYRLYQLTGDPQWLAQFRIDLAWYAARINAAGIFTPKGQGDTKYSYITPLALAVDAGEMTLAAARPIADRIYAAWEADWPNVANLGSAALWTEREMAFSLEAAISYYAMTAHAPALVRARALLDQWDAVVAATGNQGAPRVSYTKHEGGGPGGTTPTDPVSSPWMAALYFQACRRLVALAPDTAAQVYRQAAAYADYLDRHGFYPGSDAHPEFTGLTFPRYLTETTIGDAGPDEAHMAHALDVAGLLAFGRAAKIARGESTAAVDARIAQMTVTAHRALDNYTRSTTYLPKYRVNPARMGNWWVRGLYELRALGVE